MASVTGTFTDTVTHTLFTVGHSTHSFEELVAMLRGHGVASVADVRTIPKSRRHPQFNADFLAENLPKVGIVYFPFKELGGLRRPKADSPNAGWRNQSFRGYADYMQTLDFTEGLERLIAHASAVPTTIMCAEAVPWRCHRSLIADAFLVRGWKVLDISTAKRASPHKLTPFAKVEGIRITYPADLAQPELFSRLP